MRTGLSPLFVPFPPRSQRRCKGTDPETWITTHVSSDGAPRQSTFRAFFLYTGMRLKREGIALARLDHEGHESGRSRGSSAKADDVDVVWRLRATDDGLAFDKKAARMSWVPEHVELARTDPLGFKRVGASWPAGTAAKAAELDSVGAPANVSRRQATVLLKAAGLAPGRNEVLLKAIAYRKSGPR
jgi:hypothetical protein